MSTTTITAAQQRRTLTAGNGSATFIVSLAGLMMANLAPFIMSALGDVGFDPINAGNILTLALLASAVIGLATGRLAEGKFRRTLARIGLLVAVVAFGMATFASTQFLAVAGLILGGAGVGAAISTSGAAIAALQNPNRVSAISGLVNRILITVILAIIPVLGITPLNVFATLALIALAGLLLTMWLPDAPEIDVPAEADTTAAIAQPRRVLFAGIAILLLFPLWGTSEDAIWTMAPALGGALGVDEQSMGFTLSFAAAGGILGMLVAAIIGDRFGRTIPLVSAIVLGGILKVSIGLTSDPVVLGLLIIGVNTLYAFAFALFIATAAGLDARGRWSGPLLGAYLVGSSFAPLIGGLLIEWLGIGGFTLVAGIVSFVVIIPMIFVTRVSSEAERQTALPEPARP